MFPTQCTISKSPPIAHIEGVVRLHAQPLFLFHCIIFCEPVDALTVAYTTIQPGKDAKFGDEWDASIKYTAGAMSASFATDEASATTLIAEYDLGGATAFAAMHDKDGTNNDLTTVGIKFVF